MKEVVVLDRYERYVVYEVRGEKWGIRYDVVNLGR